MVEEERGKNGGKWELVLGGSQKAAAFRLRQQLSRAYIDLWRTAQGQTLHAVIRAARWLYESTTESSSRVLHSALSHPHGLRA